MKTNQKVVDAIKESLKHSTFHGIRNIMRNEHSLVKMMWLACLIGSGSYFFYAMLNLISEYFEYPVETKIQVRQLNEITFPLVKICRNDLNTPGAKSGSPTSDRLLYLSLYSFFKNLYKSNGEMFRKTVGIKNLSDILISCTYNLRPCNASEFGYFYDFSYGSCWQFNSGRDSNGNKQPFKLAKSSGLASGLSLEIYIGSSIENNNLCSIRNSFEILIANESTDSILKIGKRSLLGKSMHFTLEKFTIKVQQKPYSNCVDNLVTEDSYPSECYKKTLQQANRQERLYHYADCSYMCFQKLLTETCNCYGEQCDPYYTNIQRKCTQLTDIKCVQKIYSEFLNNKTHMSQCDCPRECTEVGYTVTSSFTNYPTKYRADYLAKNNLIVQSKFPNVSEITQRVLEERLTSVNIYFNDLREIIIIQKPKILVYDLIARIGSQMCISLGTSFLFVGELLELIIQSVVIFLNSFKN